jgi:hypothetical protein
MAYSIRFISHPSSGVKSMLAQRLGPHGKKIFAEDGFEFSAVGLIQGKLVDMIHAADIAEKAATVDVFDLRGLCPQHITMIGIFGDMSAVKASLDAVKNDDGMK